VKFEAPRGTHDVIPAEQPVWRRIGGTFDEVCDLYGYRPIETPAFEDTELFARTSGAGSDVVQKEMYTFEDRAGRSLTLRPELTAPICRAYVQHGMHREPQPVKLYSVATSYRYAAPQRGRYREFWQASIEAIGSDDPAVDAEVIHLYSEVLRRLGIKRWELQLNSIGDRACRPAYVEELKAWLDANADALDEEARQKRATNPLRVFDTKNPEVAEALQSAPKIGDALCDACRTHFEEVRAHLDAYGVPYTVTPTLVRGLDYYTRTTWEFIGPQGTAQSTLSGGGRYDYLVEEIGGPPTPAIGFGAGIERLVLALRDEGIEPPEQPGVDVFFLRGDGTELAPMMALRRRGIRADTDYAGRSRKGQLTQAQRLRAKRILEPGEEP
jgi:histidyl-tRNA synthetase